MVGRVCDVVDVLAVKSTATTRDAAKSDDSTDDDDAHNSKETEQYTKERVAVDRPNSRPGRVSKRCVIHDQFERHLSAPRRVLSHAAVVTGVT